jgi:HSP20 family protein
MSLLLRDPVISDTFRLMDQVVARVLRNGDGLTGWTPALDLFENEDEYLVQVDLPGVKAEDVSIELVDNVLTISGTRVYAGSEQSMRRLERPYGSFLRRLSMPEGVEAEKVRATFADGVLSIAVPKPAASKPRRIAIAATSEQKAIEA